MKKIILIALLTFFIASVGMVFWGCAGYDGDKPENVRPNLYTALHDGMSISTAFIARFYGTDRDGEVYNFEIIDIPFKDFADDTTTYGKFHRGDSLIPDYGVDIYGDSLIPWKSVHGHMDTVYFSLEEGMDSTEHLFCMKAVDVKGADSDIQCFKIFRKNNPPDSVKVTNPEYNDPDYVNDTLWCLSKPTSTWTGMRFGWYGYDEDDPLFMEYKYVVVNRETGDVVASSMREDTLDVPSSGYDPRDGWLREVTEVLLYDIPTGDYWFIIMARDDAFEYGAADSVSLTIVKPKFDPTDSLIYDSILNGSFEHNVLLVDETTDGIFAGTPADSALTNGFYRGMMDQMVERDVINGYSFHRIDNVIMPPTWTFTKHQLAEHSIIYWYDLEKSANPKMTSAIAERLEDYINVGGSFLLEGRKCFVNSIDFKTTHFGITDIKVGSFLEAQGLSYWVNESEQYEYPSLEIDNDMLSLSEPVSAGFIPDVNGYSISTGNPTGAYSAEPLYMFKDIEGSSAAHNKPVAFRYKTFSFRTAFFGFPLMMMDNSEGAVTDALERTLEFLKEKYPLSSVIVENTDENTDE